MATSGGRLGAAECDSGAWKTIYAPASGLIVGCILILANRATATRDVKVAVTTSVATPPVPGDGETVLPQRQLAANPDNASGKDVLTIGPIMLNGTNNERIAVHASGVDVDAVVMGATEN